MPAYLISDVGSVAPEDQEAWKLYLALAPAAIAKYGGRYLVRGGELDIIEGNWRPHAIVVAEFPDRESVKRWYESPEYAEALAVRSASGLRRNMICVEGTLDSGPDKLLGKNTR